MSELDDAINYIRQQREAAAIVAAKADDMWLEACRKAESEHNSVATRAALDFRDLLVANGCRPTSLNISYQVKSYTFWGSEKGYAERTTARTDLKGWRALRLESEYAEIMERSFERYKLSRALFVTTNGWPFFVDSLYIGDCLDDWIKWGKRQEAVLNLAQIVENPFDAALSRKEIAQGLASEWQHLRNEANRPVRPDPADQLPSAKQLDEITSSYKAAAKHFVASLAEAAISWTG